MGKLYELLAVERELKAAVMSYDSPEANRSQPE